jgi:hypothetical protein
MTPLDRLRLAVALAHPVAGSQVVLTCVSGRVVRATNHPSGDLTLCQLRRLALTCAGRDGPDLSRILHEVTVAGALQDLGAGIYRHRPLSGLEQRWFATFLAPDTVAGLCRSVPVPSDVDLSARIYPDVALGVTVVCVEALDDTRNGRVDGVAFDASLACLIGELRASTPRRT